MDIFMCASYICNSTRLLSYMQTRNFLEHIWTYLCTHTCRFASLHFNAPWPCAQPNFSIATRSYFYITIADICVKKQQ